MTLIYEMLVACTGCTPAVAQIVAPRMAEAMDEFEINTLLRQAHFIAQTAYESTLYTRTQENLNYNEVGLKAVFSKYFAPTPGMPDAAKFARMPAMIANHVYANRLGNGNETSGDGWRYRGRGFIQLTGRSNYSACGLALSVMLESGNGQDWLMTAEGACASAGWFWKTHNINEAADRNSVFDVTRLINGGSNGLSPRTVLTQRAITALGASPT